MKDWKNISAVVLVLSIFLFAGAKAQAIGQPGEVGNDEAYVQDRKVDEVNKVVVTTIKVKKAGTYYVVVGYTKGASGKWLRGLVTGHEYFRVYTITLGDNDTITLRASPGSPPPIGSRWLDVGIYRSLQDIQTNR